MYGNQLVTSTSIFTVGYVIGQIPANLLLTRVSPRWVIPTVSDSEQCGPMQTLTRYIARGRLGYCHHLHVVSQVLQGAVRLTLPRRSIRVSYDFPLTTAHPR